MEAISNQALVFYDGECGLCHRMVGVIRRNDRREAFRLVELQSEEGRQYAQQYGFIIAQEPESVILIQQGKVYQRSEAALRIARGLGGGWALLYPLVLLPARLRDGIYNWIARHRYRFFGRKTACAVSLSPKGKNL